MNKLLIDTQRWGQIFIIDKNPDNSQSPPSCKQYLVRDKQLTMRDRPRFYTEIIDGIIKSKN